MRNFYSCIVLLLVMFFGLPLVETENTAFVANAECVKTTGQNVRLRYGPGTEYQIYCSLKKGVVMSYLGVSSDGDWYYVNYKGQNLYVSRDYASLCQCRNQGGVAASGDNYVSSPKTKCIVHAKNLRLRVGPGTNYDYLIWTATGRTVHLNHGDVLPYLGVQTNGFYKVSYQGVECWVSSDYCTLK